jgi:hypothetical protein
MSPAIAVPANDKRSARDTSRRVRVRVLRIDKVRVSRTSGQQKPASGMAPFQTAGS